jgi:hypothetical protein
MGAASERVVPPPDDEALGPLRLGGTGSPTVDHLDEHGDPIAFCDCLAQPSCARHGS